MNFYIDFEATQFTEEIISIGCVAENGNTFNCLVIPSDIKKITKFITDLTGITREMVEENGYSPEMAFANFYQFVKENNGDTTPVFYCYGNMDKVFIKNTVKHMQNLNMILFASSVQALMVDYSNTVKSYLSSNGLSLKKLLALVRHVEEVNQDHDALNDALMLKECFEGLPTLERSAAEIKPISQKKPNDEFQKAYDAIVAADGKLEPLRLQGRSFTKDDNDYMKSLRTEVWGTQSKAEDISGDATADEYMVKMTKIRTGEIKYFSSPWVAAMFVNAYILRTRSCKEGKAINTTMKEMGRNPNNFCGYRCEIKMPIEKGE